MIKLICVDKVKEKFLKEGIEDFTKRINYFGKFEIQRIKSSEAVKEGKDILSKISNEHVFILSEEGKEFSSEEFADKLFKINKDVIFVIGGTDGISDELKKKGQLISLSKMTFTHEMAQLFFVEQIYRCFMIKNNKRYHRWKQLKFVQNVVLLILKD